MTVFDVVTRKLLPLALFPAISYAAIRTVFSNFVSSGAMQASQTLCHAAIDANSSPYRLLYTGFVDADHLLCGLVTFFHGFMIPSFRPFIGDLMTGLTIIALVPYLEASRDEPPIALRFPVVFGVLYQTASMAVVMPVYWLAFIFTGAATRHRSTGTGSSKINQGNAEALLFSLIVGFIIPSACMFVMEDPIVTAIWQGFPLIMQLAIFMHRLVRSPSRLTQSGYRIVQATYILIFISSAVIHIYMHWPIIENHELLKALYIPSLVPLSPETATFELGVRDFIQWDLIFGGMSTVLATFWFADNLKQLIVLLVWHVTATGAFGPGAAIAGAYMWREARLNAQEGKLEGRKIKLQ